MEDDTVKGLDGGSLSSGQVADSLGKDSKKYSWLKEKCEGEDNGRLSDKFSFSTSNCLPFSALPHFIPHHGIAMDALAKKRSKDLISLAFE